MFGFKAVLAELKEIRSLIKPADTLAAYSEFEGRVGIPGIIQLYETHPRFFSRREFSGDHQKSMQQIEQCWRELVPAIPAFKHAIADFHQATDDRTVYATILDRSHSVQALSSKGLTISGFNSFDSQVSGAANRHDIEFIRFIYRLRGTFQYRETSDSAVVIALPIEIWPTFTDLTCSRLRDKAVIPPERIIGVVPPPTRSELMFLEQVMRSYWRRLKDVYGYTALRESPYRYDAGYGQNPDSDVLPKELVGPDLSTDPTLPSAVNIDEGSAFRLTLESWHRLSKINQVIRQHQQKETAHPLAATS